LEPAFDSSAKSLFTGSVYYQPLWSRMNSTENSHFIRGHKGTLDSQRNFENFEFLFDLDSILDYTFPCANFEDEQNLNEWLSLMFEIWLPCHSNLSFPDSNRSSKLQAEVYGVRDEECDSKINCSLNSNDRRVLKMDLSGASFLSSECRNDFLMPDDWKRNSNGSDREEDTGYRILELDLSAVHDLGLVDPRAYGWLGVRLRRKSDQQERDGGDWMSLLEKQPPYLRLKTQSGK
jgi:hypothetical protein